MICRLGPEVGIVALCVASIASAGALAQAHVRLVPQLGGGADLSSVAISPNGHLVITSDGNTVRLWDALTGRQIRSFNGPATVVSLSFSPNSRSVLTGGTDDTARLWDAATGQQIREFPASTGGIANVDGVTSVAFSPDGRYVFTGGGTARLWDASNGQQLRSFETGSRNRAESVGFSPDGRLVLIGCGDGTTRMLDSATGLQVRIFKGHAGDVLSVAFSPDGRFALTGGEDETVGLWDVSTGQRLHSLQGKDNSEFNSVAFSPNGRYFIAAQLDGAALLWDASTGEYLRSFGGSDSGLSSVAFSPDGHFVLTDGKDGARLWDTSTGQQIRSFEGHTNPVRALALSPDGRFLLTGDWNSTAMWDLAKGQQDQTFKLPKGHSVIASVGFSPDGRFVLAGSNDRTTRMWNASTGQPVHSFVGDTFAGSIVESRTTGSESMAFSPDGRFLLTGSDHHTAWLWNVTTGRKVRSFENSRDTDMVLSVAFAPNGRSVLTGISNGHVLMWDAETGKQTRSFEGHTIDVVSAAFSPDGRTVATGSYDMTARLWDTASAKPLHSLTGHTGAIHAVAFSSDGNLLLTGSSDSSACLWKVETGQRLRCFVGHSEGISSVAFLLGDRFAITGSDDTTTRLWDVASGRQLLTLLSFDNGGWAVVDPEGRFDTSDLDGGAPLVWVADNEPMRPLALEIFMRDYYTPRLLSRIINGEELPQVRPIAEITNRVQPEVSIISVAPSKTRAGRVNVVVRAASGVEEKKDEKGDVVRDSQGKAIMQASGLLDLRLFRDGQLVANTKLGEALSDGDFAFDEIQLPTSSNSVTFTAYAFNSERIKSPTVTRAYTYKPGVTRKPRAWLLQIGVNHYEAAGCELHGSVNDAVELSRVLAQRLRDRGLDIQPPMLLVSDGTQEGATRERIQAALAKIATEATPDDVFFLSFSGHGYGDKNGQFYIFPANIVGSCGGVNATLLKNAISADELAEWLRPIDAGEMTFVLDSCQSASSVEANDFKPGPMGSRGLGQLAYDKRIRILAASQSNQAAHESDSLHQGLLSYALAQEGLAEGKADWKPEDYRWRMAKLCG